MADKGSQKQQQVQGNSHHSLADETESSEDVIARLLQATPTLQSSTRPTIQDAAGPPPPTRPKFEMPDLAGSASLLARVQSFLPQLQQANTTLPPIDHAGGSAFELIEESSDDEGDELTSKDIKLAREGESDEDSDDSETADVGPQIVMNLALGVLEEKKRGAEADTSSDESSSDEDSSSGDDMDESEEHNEKGQKSNEKDEIKIAMPNSVKGSKQGKKPLIQEMS